jgi:hypothetical protein
MGGGSQVANQALAEEQEWDGHRIQRAELVIQTQGCCLGTPDDTAGREVTALLHRVPSPEGW